MSGVSVVIPCLNEEESISECVRRIKKAFAAEPELEILVADNGSLDRSVELATASGARVLHERRRGYGSAIMRGLAEAKGDYVVIGDADNTYDFEDARELVEALKNGAEFAIGDRLRGSLEQGAMPWLHRHLGTPVLSFVINRLYGANVNDINCGLRAFKRQVIPHLRLSSPGMEFASEMLIHARKANLKIVERPIRYYRRRGGQAKLRTFRDGWRHLRFIMLFAPMVLFVLPSVLGIVAALWLFTSDRLGVQALGGLVILGSLQVFLFGVLAKTHLWAVDSFDVDQKFGGWVDRFRLEYGILLSVLVVLLGALFVGQVSLAHLIKGFTIIAAGVQIFFSSFLLSIILLKKRDKSVPLG